MVKEKKKVAFISVIAAVFLTGFKLIVGLLTGSLGILSEALHSGLDLVAAVITYFSVKISDKPADEEHNYGHGKVENLSAFFETILLLITCVWIVFEAVDRIINKNTHIEVTIWSYIVVISSIIIDINRSRMLSKAAKKHNSQALEADALHFSTDIWSSVVVLLGLIGAQFGLFLADSIAAIAVALIVLFVSYRLGRRAIDVLIDKAPTGSKDIVNQVLENYPEVKRYHQVKLRTSGADTFIKFNIHVDPLISLKETHELCDKIEQDIKNQIPRCEIFIHAEPEEESHILQEME